jgi:predicted transcriptional regulator
MQETLGKISIGQIAVIMSRFQDKELMIVGNRPKLRSV